MMSAASGGLPSTMRPMTSYAVGSHSQEAAGPGELRADDLPPCANPAGDMHCVLSVLASAKLANRLDVDWQAQLQVMQACVIISKRQL